MITPGRNLVNQYATIQRKVLSDDIAYCKRIEHPLSELVIVDILRIGYIVEITANFLTVNHYSEDAIDSFAPSVERSSRELVSVAEIYIALPTVGKVLM